MLGHIQEPSTVALLLQGHTGRVVLMAELPIGVHLQAHGVVHHGLPRLDWDPLPDVHHSVRG